MLKVIGVVILPYIILTLSVIYLIKPAIQLTTDGQSLEERINQNVKHAEYYNLVIDVINTIPKSMAAFNNIDLLNQETAVDFTPLTETVDKTLEKLKQVIESDTDPIEISNEDESYLKPLVDSHTELKEQLIEMKQDMENVNTQIQTILSDRENAATSNISIQSINKLYDSFEKISDTFGSINSVYINTLNIFLINTSMTRMQLDWDIQVHYNMNRVVGMIIICCLLSIVMAILIMKPKRLSMKQISDKDSSE